MNDGDDIVTEPGNPIPHLDGNAAAGVLMELFNADLTAASGRCEQCGAIRSIADTLVYRDAPGLIVRCRSCQGILLRLVKTPEHYSLDLRGLSYLRIARTDTGAPS